MRSCPVSHQLDEGWTATFARALRRPLSDSMHRQEVVAVNANAGHAIAQSARGKRTVLAARKALEGRDRPLVVDEVEDHGSPVDLRESHRMMEVGLRTRALAYPTGRDVILALVRGGHGPADRLRKLSAEVAGDRENVAATPVVHDGHLASLAH